jgi:hypothetical protein
MKLYIEQKNGSKFFIEEVSLCEAREEEVAVADPIKNDPLPDFIQTKMENKSSTFNS